MSFRYVPIAKAGELTLMHILACIMILFPLSVRGQVDPDEEPENYYEEQPAVFTVKRFFQIGANTGFMQLCGELENDINPPVADRFCGSFYINYGLTPSITIGLAVNTGSLFGQFRSDSTSTTFANLNVRTPIFAPQLRLGYNFGGLYKNDVPGVLQPWVYTGLEFLYFNPLSDLTNNIGTPYHYWKDGTIRDMPETPENSGKAGLMQRDYIYETILRDADFDGYGSYSRTTFSIPIGIGMDINLNQQFTISLGASYHYTFTDFLDNITHKSGSSDPTRAIGDKSRDAFLMVLAGISFKYFELKPIGTSGLIILPYPRLPVDFIPFDIDANGILQREEVLLAIEDLLNGESFHSLELIELLIDFFNVQQATEDKIKF